MTEKLYTDNFGIVFAEKVSADFIRNIDCEYFDSADDSNIFVYRTMDNNFYWTYAADMY